MRAVFTPLSSLQASLGRPNREQIVTSRPELVTTLEAFQLANGKELSGFLRLGADRLLKENFSSPDALVQHVFAAALLRPPTAKERTVALKLVGDRPTQEGVEDLLWAVFHLPEFHFIR